MAEIAIAAISLALSVFDTVSSLYQTYSDGSTNIPVDFNETMNQLKEIQVLLTKAEDQIDGGPNLLQQYVKDVEHIAYDIEDALSVFLCRIHGSRGFSQKMHNIVSFLPGNEVKKAGSELSSKIDRITQKKRETVQKLEIMLQPIEQNGSSSRRKQIWPDQVLAQGDEIMGFEDSEKKLIRQLLAVDENRLALVAGPGGSGKSTMVQSVYRSNMTRGGEEGFSCQAWIDAPSMELKVQIFTILRQFQASRQGGNDSRGETDDVLEPETAKTTLNEENDPEEKLRLLVQKNRFLVVIDNVWSKSDLEFIVGSLREGLPGSKIIITTRNSDVTSAPPNYIHDLSCGLPSEKAKQLFCRKAFQNNDGNWPEWLDEWAQKILKRCEGMPLPISAIGSSLAKRHHTPSEWKTQHAKLGYEICRAGSDLFVIKRNLQPSYEDLPSHLRSCFLYLSIFPEDYSISREKLIRLWVAEGFVRPEDGEPKERSAGDFLDELFRRNLVVACAKDVDGRVRRCRVLHLVREINISRRKNFLTVLDQNYHPSGDGIRRLSVNNGRLKSVKGMTRATRTLLVFGLVSSPSELKQILKTSKFLRVLDLQGVALEAFPKHILGLTLLKYLSLRGTLIKKVPKSIKKLIYLETLDVRHTSVSLLPKQICKLKMLRHLLVFCKDGGSGGVVLPAGNLGDLSSIQKLSLIKVETDSAILEALAERTGLKKLGLTDLKKEDGIQLCSSIQQMQDLSTLDVRATSQAEYLDMDHMSTPLQAPLYLQSLYLEGRLERVPKWIPELTSLKKIGLKWSTLQDNVDPLHALQALPSLVELNLINYYTGKMLVFGCGTFAKLLVLSIEEFDQLNFMEFEHGAMCMLKKLIVCNCKNLRSLPVGVPSLSALEEFRWINNGL